MTGRGKVSIFIGLMLLGLSPSFVDWIQSPEHRGLITLYYGGIAALIAFGLWDGG